jgi:CBS domain-containing protein
MHRIPVRQIMTDTVITIHPEELVADAAQLMEEFDLRRLPVVDDDDCLVGIVTDSDVLQAEAAGSALRNYEPGIEAEWLTVADIMTREVVTIGVDATVGQLATKMIEHKVGWRACGGACPSLSQWRTSGGHRHRNRHLSDARRCLGQGNSDEVTIRSAVSARQCAAAVPEQYPHPARCCCAPS